MMEATYFDITRPPLERKQSNSGKARHSHFIFRFCFNKFGSNLAGDLESGWLRGACALGSAFLHQHDSDPLQQFNGSVHAFRQKDIGVHVFIIDTDFSGEQNSRRGSRNLFDLVHQLRAIQAGHLQITQHQVNTALLEELKGLMAIRTGQNAIATCFQHKLSYGERLLIVVDAQNGSFWSHHSPGNIFSAAVRRWAYGFYWAGVTCFEKL